MLQNGHPVAYASKAFTETQKAWAQIEKELYALVFGCEHFKQYVLGKSIDIESDHKPLIPIFKKSFTEIPVRLQKMRLRLQTFEINLIYKPGKELILADALSRAQLNVKNDDPDINASILDIKLSENMSDSRKQEFIDETKKDLELRTVLKLLKDGWPDEKSKVLEEAKPYHTFKDNLYESDGLLFNNDRVVVPKSLRKIMLDKLHFYHMGEEKTKNRARKILYWPNMSKEIDDRVKNCETCLKFQKSNSKEELKQSEIPLESRPMVGTDLFYFQSKAYLIVVDYFSKYVEFRLLRDESSESTIELLKSYFARFGVPKIIRSDNGPQFNSRKFKDFSKQWNFTHVTSSPKYPHSNGFVERQIQTVKRILKKADFAGKDPLLALLEFRNTPITNSIPLPNKILLGKNVRGIFPEFIENKEKNVYVTEQLKMRQEREKKYYDKCSRNLPIFKIKDKVRFQLKDGTWQKAQIVSLTNNDRSYKIITETGRFLIRNRKHLRRNADKDFKICQETYYDSPVFTEATNVQRASSPIHQPEIVQLEQPIEPNVVNHSIIQKRQYNQKAVNLEPKISKHGRQIKPPSYLKDYVTTSFK